MANGFFNVPIPVNEPVKSYVPGSKEREELQQVYNALREQQLDIPMYIGAEEVRTDNKVPFTPPHDHQHVVAHYHYGNASHVQQAIDAALAAREQWSQMPWESRAAIFLKAADLLAGPFRARMNAATMIGQSKNVYQAEIDAACEMIDFFRFNAKYMTDIYKMQPESLPGMWNRLEHRPLEGFVFALTPFNFTSIAANLPAAPAMMGNVVVWKPANTQIYSAQVVMELFKAAGLPAGVINLVYVDGPEAGEVIFRHRQFAGIHFTGSTGVFNHIWKSIADNINTYRNYPRIVGETGGKDFIVAHRSANAKEVATAITRGAFEYQGQKCSAASRAYIPNNIWDEVKAQVVEDLKSFKMGDPGDFSNFINAVIDEKSFDKLARYIEAAKKDDSVEIIAGGTHDKSKGYFIEPTIIVAQDPQYVTMCEELFGPVLTLHVYDADKFEETLQIVDETSPYGLTGAIFANDRYAVELATKKLSHAAGNFYINDKPTGAVVGQQPFGGSRSSGTNDKAGSMLNLLRWSSARTIKETFVPPVDYRYPFLQQ
ncbi:L-glutamate gamma-semialdehyde dehydrogenase [Rufibacter tibetensis]|uniref:L-glutamate gamma-semialdehyde dehydrogenase n=1 Tax=Rufibacter tibetensis TaxID=512763 RepID=A0A0P0CVR7_9BACT|nr:L-glutamate gamma-semialdehyde dehydrogenase [Rufibacter tibetensis]ALI98457.1 1-pyrroline-5-carboxylate dehydrogenase [Rufibacter tibetensis]